MGQNQQSTSILENAYLPNIFAILCGTSWVKENKNPKSIF